METKFALKSVTVWGLLVALVPIVTHVTEHGFDNEAITLTVGWLVALIGRLRKGDLHVLGGPAIIAPVLLYGLCMLVGCAAPQSEQGKSAQGGSVTAPPISITINNGTGGGVTTTNTSAPTAAPASASTASAAQTATNDIKPDVALGDSAIDAVTGKKAIPVLGGAKKPVEVPVVPPVVVEPPVPPAPVDRP